ncbi:MAG TPA: inositol monophosphatase [Bryobacteraceae bacterium]|nr:inositol monophosphatase [Bryobacteraceae bacterium]
MSLYKELELARRIAFQSAELALRHQSLGVIPETKPDDSPVTIADRECERLIAHALEENFPGDGILGEEGAQKESRSGRRWIIDPIDGTRDFVRGDPLWCVLIGLEDRGETVAGVVHLPMLNQTAWAARGAGAYRNEKRLRVSSISEVSHAVISVNALTRVGGQPFAPNLIDFIGRFWSYRCLGGTPDAIMLAAGESDAWVEPSLHEWDLAAVQVILEEAGAKFFSFRGERTIYHTNAIACTPALESALRAFFVA